MNNILTLWRREMAAYFFSPLAYVTLVVFLLTTSGTFMVGVLRNIGGNEPLASLLFEAVFLWLPILLTVVSMRLFAEEKRSGTIETLMTAPVTDTQVVLGKYAGALTFILLVGFLSLSPAFILARLSPGIDLVDVDLGSVAGGGAILVLVSALLLAVGLLVSLMTKNQVVSAICTLCAIWLVLMVGWLLSLIPGSPRHLTDYLSITRHIDDFARGSVELSLIVMYLSSTAFVLFSAVRVLESRRWK
jgi:ABC-2 type transport system permease protein